MKNEKKIIGATFILSPLIKTKSLSRKQAVTPGSYRIPKSFKSKKALTIAI